MFRIFSRKNSCLTQKLSPVSEKFSGNSYLPHKNPAEDRIKSRWTLRVPTRVPRIQLDTEKIGNLLKFFARYPGCTHKNPFRFRETFPKLENMCDLINHTGIKKLLFRLQKISPLTNSWRSQKNLARLQKFKLET